MRKKRGPARTNEQRLALLVRHIVYVFRCDDCGKKWARKYVDDHGESYARASIRHRCSGKLLRDAQ